ncbi:hypothetical protein WJX73_005618 [Symbiochloris irregularis]|uniref:dolichyl-phosphate beta-glucosyltransferase n=1 Tax=Symbiochloris irregularis TaxID=706552 RepID=A0AAW1NTN2_9CHLO
MDWLMIAVICVAGTLGFGIRWTMDWFAQLNRDSLAKSAELVLENPTSLSKVANPSLYSEASKSLSLVVPAYNEESRLPSTLEETLRYLQGRRDSAGANFTYEIIVVDDGSRDGTVSKAFEYTRKYGFDAVRVLRLPVNRGKGYAVKAGMMVSRGVLLLMMDADGATRVSDLGKLEAELHKLTHPDRAGTSKDSSASSRQTGDSRLGMAVGSRAHLEQQALAKRHWLRNFLMRGFHLLVMLVAGGAVRDTQCGFKLFTREAAQLLYGNQRLQRWCFDVELLFLASRLGIPVAEVAVAWTEIPGSKIKATSILHMLWEMGAILDGVVPS